MQTLYALDLTDLPGQLTSGDRDKRPIDPPAMTSPSPADGFASPLGFWFAAAESWGTAKPTLRVEVRDLDALERHDHALAASSSGDSGPKWRSYRAGITLNAPRARPARKSTPVLIEVEPSVARIGIAPDSWSSVAQPVLIVVAQFWRFFAIDRTLDDLADWARGDLFKRGWLDLIRRQRARELHARRRELQALILDLPDFEVFLTNPRAGLASGRSIRVFLALARQLRLDQYRRALDERVEVVEAVLDSLAESLNHLQNLACQLVLELAIVSLLILDVGLYFLNATTR